MKSEKVELWKRRRKAFQQSGSTRRAFCAKNHLKISTLDYWFSRIREEERSQGLVELKTLVIPAVKRSLEVVVADRYRIEVGAGIDIQLFKELVKALESLG
jgi:hypothetical protein